MRLISLRCFTLLPVVLILLLAGCDSGDPIDGSNGGRTPVAGTYAVEVLSIVPDATVIPTLNLRDTLVLADTRLRLYDEGAFVLDYRYRGDSLAVLFGTYTFSDRDVRLRADRMPSDRQDLRSLLMPETLTLQRVQDDPNILSVSLRKTVDYSMWSDAYDGIPPLASTLQFRLREEEGAPLGDV